MAETAFRLLEGGDDWRKSLPERPVSENMMRWQKFYHDPCGSLCCFSPDCACIRCSNCRASLTTIPPKRRFQCMECEVLPPESSFDSRPEYCELCFSLPDVLHWHKHFLLVDESGVHQAVERLAGLAEMHSINTDDFPLKDGLGEHETCGICCIEFSADDPATCNVGCTIGHGEGAADGQHGVVDSGMFYHAECRMNWIKAQKTDTYCGQLPLTCKVCFFVADCKAWQSDFQRGVAAIAEFYKEDSGTPVEWEELLLGDAMDIFWSLFFRTDGFLKAQFQIVLTVSDTGRASDLQTAFRGALQRTREKSNALVLVGRTHEEIFERILALLKEVREPQSSASKESEDDEIDNVWLETSRSSKQYRKEYARLFQEAWLKLLGLRVPLAHCTSLLQLLPTKVIPHMGRPLMVADFYLRAFHAGSLELSVLALSGLLLLLTRYGLGDPETLSSSCGEFYSQLYSLLRPATFRLNRRARFQRLAAAALTSALLPARFAAAFAKKCLRVAILCSEPGTIMWLLAVAYGLIQRNHSRCSVLLHRPGEEGKGTAFGFSTEKEKSWKFDLCIR
ncbi:unnamed protein product [Cladocopium goreaui]|uniref:Nucleolar complex protein 4 homolog (NOC4 protein homolog) (NOC4-like protein) (Nucleolar complex-associated protein 4-like protein) n=1 Tax=Cladocopium goreaui TaxID=2562237 RepID=A0A9P1FRP0_9DINO|nr:unnamed protein product [Cladocopium goreaui]